LRDTIKRYRSFDLDFYMDFAIHIVARIVAPLFFLGMAGSAVVIVVSFAEDLKELLGDED
jgi:hypothetical protein